eukprot:Selendium_serpulae@DN3698_c0_g1_i1.p1
MWSLLTVVALFSSRCLIADAIGKDAIETNPEVARCEVVLKDTGISMPVFYIPNDDVHIFKSAVANAEAELRREALASLQQQKSEEARKALETMMQVEFTMRCQVATLKDFDQVTCAMCNYHETPSDTHLVQGTVVNTDITSCITGVYPTRRQPGLKYHPTCFPELPQQLMMEPSDGLKGSGTPKQHLRRGARARVQDNHQPLSSDSQ